jgi:hypothetical protein
MDVILPENIGGTMPEFETISVKEAQFRTMPGRRGRFMNEYASYVLKLPYGQAGKLCIFENEKSATVRRRLIQAAQALDTKLIIKRSRDTLYFWKEDGVEEQPRSRRGRRPRRQGETAEPKQPVIQPQEEFDEKYLTR